MEMLSSGQDLLFTLLLKVVVAASLAALLVRSAIFRKVLYTEIRDSDLKVKLMLLLTPAFAMGVVLRLIGGFPYRFADLMLEGSFLLGLLGGRVVGPELAAALVKAFLEAHYIGNEPGGERLARRVAKIRKLEE